MSQAAQPILSGPAPAPTARGRAKLFAIPLAVLVIVAIPGGAFAYASNQLSQAQTLENQGKFGDALAAYQTVQSVAGNPVSRLVMSSVSDKAALGAAKTHFEWGQQDQQGGNFADGESQFQAAVGSGLADWVLKGNAALAATYLAWGDALVKTKQFSDAIDKYRQVATFDTSGALHLQAQAAMAIAYAAYADHYSKAQPPDYASALNWYKDLVKQFPSSPEAKQASTSWIPQTLYNGGLAYVSLQHYQQARDAMTAILKDYTATPWAAKATAAMTAPQPLTGRLITPSGAPVANRLLRISTKWIIVAPHTYDDYGGHVFSTTTDGNGNFSLVVPPGQNYLVTWWDPARGTFVTTFVNDTVPVNQITINPLEPEHANVEIA
jgi:hypothetical protein